MTTLSGVYRKARNTDTSTAPAAMTAHHQSHHLRVHFETDHSNNNITTTASIEDFNAARSNNNNNNTSNNNYQANNNNNPLVLRPIIKHPFNSSKTWTNTGTGTVGGDGGGGVIDGDDMSAMTHFLFAIECEMINSVASLVTFLRQILPDQPIEHCDQLINGHPFFPIGTKLFYRYDNGEMQCVLEGIVKNINPEQQSYDLMLVNKLVDTNVHYSKVCYTSLPLIQFQPLSELNKHDMDEIDHKINRASNSSNNSDGAGGTSFIVTTAHLLRTLQLVTSPVAAYHLQEDNYAITAQNAELIAGQLVWIIISTIDHHARAPLDRETSMINQLDDLMRIIRANRGSTSTITSPSHTAPLKHSYQQLSTDTITNRLAWMQNAGWISFTAWVEKRYERICYSLQMNRGMGLARFDSPDGSSPIDQTGSFSDRKRKKRYSTVQ
jgi:hypothetical protein